MLNAWIEKRLGDFDLKVSLTAEPREVTALFGPSGSGKTSLVKAIAGLITPDRGRLVMDDEVLFDREKGINLPPQRRRMGYVFQEGRLFPHLSVRSNLLYGHDLLPPAQRRLGLEAVVELMGIGHLLARRPANLSGGEKQRVAVGRALLCNPRLLLMDEPLASLDQGRKDEVLPFLSRLPAELDMPILYVSHSMDEIEALGARVLAIHHGRVLAPVAGARPEPATRPSLAAPPG